MKTNEHTLIGVLVVTAAILGVLLVGSMNSRQAQAAISSDHFGDYIMTTGAWTNTNDLLYVVDVPNKKLLVYGCDPANNKFVVVDDRVNFADIFRASR